MALNIYWSVRADQKMDKMIEYTHQQFGERVVRAFVRKVYETIDLLTYFPEMGAIQNESRGIRGFLIMKNVILFYKIKQENLIILNLFDTRKNITFKKK